MKRFYLIALLVIVLSSCGNGDTANTMTVNGNIKGLKKGTLYLQHIPDSVLITIDSLQIDGDGNFSFKTELESPEVFYLYLDKKDNNAINDRITFFGEPGTTTINTAWNTFDTKAKIAGSITQKKLEEFRKVMTRFNMQNLEMVRASNTPDIKNDSLALDSLLKASDRNVVRGYLYALNFAINNKDSYIAPYIALTEVSNANPKYLDSIYNSLSEEVANSKYGKELKGHIASIKAE